MNVYYIDILPEIDLHLSGSQRHMLIGTMKNQLDPSSNSPIEIWQTPAFRPKDETYLKADKYRRQADIVVIQGKIFDRNMLTDSSGDIKKVKLPNTFNKPNSLVKSNKMPPNNLGITSNTAGELCIQRNGMSITEVNMNSSVPLKNTTEFQKEVLKLLKYKHNE